MPLTAHALRPRAGVTLVELVVVMTLLAIVGSALMSFITRQQRFYRGTSQIMDNRSQLRQAVAYFPVALRGVSTAAGVAGAPDPDVLRIGTAGITYRQVTGTSIGCGGTVTGGYITAINLPPAGKVGSDSATLTRFLSDPVEGDIAWLYSEGPDQSTTGDDRWISVSLLAPVPSTSSVTCPTTTGFTVAADDPKPTWRLPIPSGVVGQTEVIVGAALRFTRVYRDTLYQASDGRWYLGHSECNVTGTTCLAPEPVAGPFRPFSTTQSETGLLIRYFDDAGAPLIANTLANRRAIARIDITVRGTTPTIVPIAGFGGTQGFEEEMKVSVAVRNRV